ncbi:MAG: hypothetical protein DPW17_02390 [Candidatus Jettenia sp.]|nr:hypothetical protein [Candidatus Jettenia sp.]
MRGHTITSYHGEISEGIFSIIKKLVLMKMGIGNLLGLGYSSISRRVSIMQSTISEDDKIHKQLEEIKSRIKV